MNYAVYNIALDIHKTGSQVALSMIRGENKRKIVISLTENGRPYKISEGTKVELGHFTALKPDNNFIYNECEIDEENNVIIYYVTSQTTAAVGEVKCQIKLSDNNGELLFTPQFSIIVANTLYNEEPIVASSEEFNSLTKYLADLQQKLANGEFKGDKGDKGDRGPQGIQGNIGPAGKDADISSLAPAIVCTSTGSSIVVSDSSESGFEGLSIYGKSTQNGTPTPDAPVDIVSVGDDGGVDLTVCGKVLTDWSNITLVGNPIFSYKGNKIQYENNSGERCIVNGVPITLPIGTYTAYIRDMSDKTSAALVGIKGLSATKYLSHGTPRIVLNITQPTTINLIATTSNQTEKLAYSCYVGIVMGDVPIESCPITDENVPSKQSFTLTTSLQAIPVTDSSLATYTDANGQMWCADEIDLERGVYVQRIKQFSLKVADMNNADNYPGWKGLSNLSLCFASGVNTYQKVLSNAFEYINVNTTTGNQILWITTSLYNMTQTQWKEKYPNLVCTFYFPLITPIETPLTSEQIAAYKALKTNYPNTTILNDENAFMKVAYRADTKNFIKRMAGSTAQISSVTLAASKWVGSASPYTQVVTIPGATPNSKIDLNPTVEQLNIFHNKDISFVVGNKNGTITVYCIGQKPTQDYTMQTTITEVAINV